MGVWVTLGPWVPPKCDLSAQDPPIGDLGPFHGGLWDTVGSLVCPKCDLSTQNDTGIPLWDNWVPLMGVWVTLGPSVPPKCDLSAQDPP